MSSNQQLPTLTAADHWIGGRLKCSPADFRVDEIPAYLPCGEGEHLFLFIEKEDVAAEQLVMHLARALQVPRGDIGVAGMKDRQAITRQWVSVPARHSGNLTDVTTDKIRLLESALHRNKLKTGHLRGNRFAIVLREPHPDTATRLPQLLAAVESRGVPNYFGDQRFGREGGTLQLGLDLLAGRKSPGSIPYSRRKFLLRLALSSVQSMLFNQVLQTWIERDLLRSVHVGDIMQVCQSGGLFIVEDLDREQSRLAEREIVSTGPLFGAKMKTPSGLAGDIEAEVLSQHSLTLGDFDKFPNLTSGARRPLLVFPENLKGHMLPGSDAAHLEFTLPSGCYATVVLREFTGTCETLDDNNSAETADAEAASD